MLKKDIKRVVSHFKGGMRYADVKKQLQAEHDQTYAFNVLQKGFLRYKYVKTRNNALANLSYVVISFFLIWSASKDFTFDALNGRKYIRIAIAAVLLVVAIYKSYKTLKEYNETNIE